MATLAEACNGRWHEILEAIGVDPKFLNRRKNGPCPMCGGTDRFRFSDKNGDGLFWCNNCEGGNGFHFTMKYKGVGFHEAANMIELIIGYKKGVIPQEALDKIEEKKRKGEEIRKLWKRAAPITRDCSAGVYLTSRTGITEYPSSLRFVKDLRYTMADESVVVFDAMLAAVSGVSGKLVNVHRTYLTQSGEKAPVDDCRRMMPGELPAGVAVRLYQTSDKLVVAEGIETAISASIMFGIPAWALLNADRMRNWVPPQNIRHIIVAGDHDVSYTGQYSGYCLAHRLVCQFKVPKVEVNFPLSQGKDWNDVWRETSAV